MKVFLVIDHDNKFNSFEACFSTQEKAQEYVKKLDNSYRYLCIYHIELDKEDSQ